MYQSDGSKCRLEIKSADIAQQTTFSVSRFISILVPFSHLGGVDGKVGGGLNFLEEARLHCCRPKGEEIEVRRYGGDNDYIRGRVIAPQAREQAQEHLLGVIRAHRVCCRLINSSLFPFLEVGPYKVEQESERLKLAFMQGNRYVVYAHLQRGW